MGYLFVMPSYQYQALYCGSGCRPAFGSCETSLSHPPNPTGTLDVAENGDNCGPIVNKRCSSNLCCSRSKYCGKRCSS